MLVILGTALVLASGLRGLLAFRREVQRRIAWRAVSKSVGEEHARDLARASMTERRLLDVATNLRTSQSEMEADMRARQELADQLTAALMRAAEVNRARNAFLAALSDRLRTPLNAIIDCSDDVLRPSVSPADNHRASVERINASGRHLLAIIDDVQDLSRIESGLVVVDVRDTDIAPLIRTVIERHATQVRPGVSLGAEMPAGPIEVRTDANRLRQVLENLVSNALRFTERGRVVVRVVLSELGAPARLEVSDTGIGIARERLEAIFEPFGSVGDPGSRGAGGTGLGLAISRQLCALLETHLTVQSTVGVGTTFALHLPVAGIRLRVRDLPSGATRAKPIVVPTPEPLAR